MGHASAMVATGLAAINRYLGMKRDRVSKKRE